MTHEVVTLGSKKLGSWKAAMHFRGNVKLHHNPCLKRLSSLAFTNVTQISAIMSQILLDRRCLTQSRLMRQEREGGEKKKRREIVIVSLQIQLYQIASTNKKGVVSFLVVSQKSGRSHQHAIRKDPTGHKAEPQESLSSLVSLFLICLCLWPFPTKIVGMEENRESNRPVCINN